MKLESDILTVIAFSHFAPSGTVWNVMSLWAEIAVPDSIPWRNAVAKEEHKAVCLGSCEWV